MLPRYKNRLDLYRIFNYQGRVISVSDIYISLYTGVKLSLSEALLYWLWLILQVCTYFVLIHCSWDLLWMSTI